MDLTRSSEILCIELQKQGIEIPVAEAYKVLEKAYNVNSLQQPAITEEDERDFFLNFNAQVSLKDTLKVKANNFHEAFKKNNFRGMVARRIWVYCPFGRN